MTITPITPSGLAIILSAMKRIRDDGPIKRHYGICSNVKLAIDPSSDAVADAVGDAALWLAEQFLDMGLDSVYPLGLHEFERFREKWGDDEHGNNRRELLDRLIARAEKQLDAMAEVKS